MSQAHPRVARADYLTGETVTPEPGPYVSQVLPSYGGADPIPPPLDLTYGSGGYGGTSSGTW